MFESKMNLAGVRFNTTAVVITTLAVNFLSLALPIMTLQVYDRVIPNQSYNTLQVLVIGVCVLVTLEALLKIARSYIVNWSGASFEHAIANQLMDTYLNSDIKHLKRVGVGAGLQYMADITRMKDFYSGDVLCNLIELAFVSIFLALVWYIGGALVLVPMVLVGLFLLVISRFSMHLDGSMSLRSMCDDRRYNFLFQALTGVHTIKSFGLEESFCRRYEYMEQESGFSNITVAQLSGFVFNLSIVFSQLMLASVISVGAYLVVNTNMTVGGLVACILLSGRVMQPIQKMLQVWLKYKSHRIAKKNVESVLATPKLSKNKAVKTIDKKGTIKLQDVTFYYPNSKDPVFEDVTFAVSAGEAVHIDGSEGVGKSTLLKVVAGLYLPDAGTVEVDGVNVAENASEILGNHVAYISDANTIFRGTIRDNITLFGKRSNLEAMEIVRDLDLQGDIAQLPSGFDTHLEGLKADTVPPSLRQKIMIARSLVSRPNVLVFDNADHAFDKSTYAILIDYIRKRKDELAIVFSTNDPVLISLANRFYLIHNKKITLQSIKNVIERQVS